MILGLLHDFVDLVVDKSFVFFVKLHGGSFRAVLVVLDFLHELLQVRGVQFVAVIIVDVCQGRFCSVAHHSGALPSRYQRDYYHFDSDQGEVLGTCHS